MGGPSVHGQETQKSGSTRRVRILGTRGIPGGHGGFESFAQDVSLYLVARGWDVTVYCQHEGATHIHEDRWRGVRLVHFFVKGNGSLSTMWFDWLCTRHALGECGVALVLGYNTAMFSAFYRLRSIRSIMNMDGLEWKRKKYGLAARAWFYLNEWLGCWLSTDLVADHPAIAEHLATRGVTGKTRTIAYGSRAITVADERILAEMGIVPGQQYVLLIARPEPENSILEIVRAFSKSVRGVKLVVLGRYGRDVQYQRAVLDAASIEVLFLGAIYDQRVVDSLRFFSTLYVHGHTVGGTNPALVEAMGAGAAVLAHDNRFNRWVAGPGAAYFSAEDDCARRFDELLGTAGVSLLPDMRRWSSQRHHEAFQLDDRLAEYEQLLATERAVT